MENEQNPPINYDAVLADLLAKREQLDKAIEAIKSYSGKNNPASIKDASNGGVDIDLRSDTFFGMTIPDAARKLLGMKRKPLNAPEVAKYLDDGGFSHTSANFANTVGSVLNRMANTESGGIAKVGRGQFGLVEWYPGYKRGKGKKNGENEGEVEVGKS